LELLAQRYQIVETLSEGGFGETWLAEDTHLPSGRRCVIKRLKPLSEGTHTYELVAGRFQREAAILEDLGEGHGQIPRLYAHFESEGQFYLVQEWVQGPTLTQRVEQQGPQSESAVRALLVALLPVLSFIHSKQIVHRDIKPDNIILRASDGQPTLIDFGAVKETMGAELTPSGSSARSVSMGTPGYMPAEQAAGRPVYASDLYALGLTAIYALTGQPPQALAADPATGTIQWREQVPLLSPTLATVLDTAVQLNTQQRYPSAQAMLAALQSEDSPLSAQATVVSAAPPSSSSGTETVLSPAPAESATLATGARRAQAATTGGGIKEWQKAILTGGVAGACAIGASLLVKPEILPFQQAGSSGQREESAAGSSDKSNRQSTAERAPNEQQPASQNQQSQQVSSEGRQQQQTEQASNQKQAVSQNRQPQNASVEASEQQQTRQAETARAPQPDPDSSNRKTRDEKIDDLADRIFYRRHPELRGRKIQPGEEALSREWNRIRQCEAIVDYRFYKRYPELNGRRIREGEERLAREWMQIKQTVSGCN